MFKLFLPAIFSLFLPGFFTSCSMSFDSYDSEYSDYEIKGCVVDEETSGVVPGVIVTLFEAVEVDDEVSMGHKIDSLEVGEDGTFVFYGRSYNGVPEYKYLRVEDLDSGQLGSYETGVFEIELFYDENPSSHNAATSHDHYIASDLVLKLKRI